MFKIGEKVVCINASNPKRPDLGFDLKQNEIYTIKGFYFTTNTNELTFHLEEIKSYYCDIWNKEIGYGAYRFRKLDYEFADNLLAEISEAMKSETILN